MSPDVEQKARIVLIGPDAAFLNAVAATLGPSKTIGVTTIPESIEQAAKRAELDAATIVVVDLDARRRESLSAVKAVTTRLLGRAPVIVVAEALDDALLRWFLQVRVADFLRKPVEPKEVLRACMRAFKTSSALPDDTGQILSFLPAAGGVGTTTLAIETAMILRRAGGRDGDTTCLVDLDLSNGVCADYLDLDPGSISTRSVRIRSASTCSFSRSC
jgi:pilus assembly protein CpaE